MTRTQAPVRSHRPTPRRFIPRLLAAFAVCLVLEGGLTWYSLSVTPVPISLQDIQHVEDYEKLINLVLPTTKGVLERDGDVAQPIAFGTEMTGQVDFLSPEGGSTMESIKQIVQDFKSGAHSGFYRSIVMAYDTTRQEAGRAPFDAIEFRFEHIDGESLRGWLPYKRLGPHKFWYGQMHFIHAEMEVFSHHNLQYGEGG